MWLDPGPVRRRARDPGVEARGQALPRGEAIAAPRALASAKASRYGSGPTRRRATETLMCRNIRTLFNFEPPASEDEIRASALQFVRKLSGFNAPSQANAAAFDRAVDEVSAAAPRLLASLATTAPPRDRETEAEKARARSRERFG